MEKVVIFSGIGGVLLGIFLIVAGWDATIWSLNTLFNAGMLLACLWIIRKK